MVIIFIIPQIHCDLTFIRNNLAKLILKIPKVKNLPAVDEKTTEMPTRSNLGIISTRNEPCTCVDILLCHNLQISSLNFDYRSES